MPRFRRLGKAPPLRIHFMATTRYGFIGAGRMATALAKGLVSGGIAPANAIVACDPVEAARQSFSSTVGGELLPNAPLVASRAEVVFLCVKPQQMPDVLAELREHVTAQHLVISIAAGITLSTLDRGLTDSSLAKQPRLVRVMPNTPCLVGQGASGYCLGPRATPADAALVAQMFNSVGRAVQVDEKLLDAVTGLSGSGPAFVCMMIEALADAGVRVGLPRAVAQTLAAQTVLGTAQMVLETGEHPAVLKDQVASPGGTTIAGIAALEARGLRGALIAAVEAATQRAWELGQASPPR